MMMLYTRVSVNLLHASLPTHAKGLFISYVHSDIDDHSHPTCDSPADTNECDDDSGLYDRLDKEGRHHENTEKQQTRCPDVSEHERHWNEYAVDSHDSL